MNGCVALPFSNIRRCYTPFRRLLRWRTACTQMHKLGRRPYSIGRVIGQPLPDTHPHLLKPGELTKGIHRDEYKNRRDVLASKMLPNSVAVFTSPPEKIMSGDIPYENHHNTDVSYLTGFLETKALAVLETTGYGRYTFTMLVKERDARKELWDGPCAGTDAMIPVFGCDKAHAIDQAKEILNPILARASMIYHRKNVWPDITKDLQLEGLYDSKVRNDLILQEQKVVKSPAEQALMQTAAIIAGEGFVQAMKFTREGMLETDLNAKLEYECKIRGAQRLAYPSVVAGGSNGLTLHYVTNNNLLRKGDMVLVDAGCEYHGYSSDITRTWPVSKKFTAAQRAVYEVVLECNKRCIELVVPGASLSLLQGRAADMLHDGLSKIGVIPSHSLTNSLFNKIYPHAIGHYLGMDVHDCHDVATSTKLRPGMIITIEPGVYIPRHPSIPEIFHGIAVRIEDDVLVTAGKPVNLTRSTPKEIGEIEALLR